MRGVSTFTVEANGLDLGYLEAGDGPLVVLLHGFPDDAWTWSAQLDALADAGHRVVAPFLRGYHPSEIPADGRYDVTSLGRDLLGLLAALNGDRPATVVGHDLGALALYAGLAEAPDRFDRAAFVGVNHPAQFPLIGLTPRLAHHGFHLWLLGTPGIGEIVAANDEMSLVDYLWAHWSPLGADNAEHVARLKRETLGREGVLGAAVAYYPALIGTPDEPGIPQELADLVSVPALVIYGSEDPTPQALAEGEDMFFTAGYRREDIAGAKHWPHRDRPDEVNAVLLDWLAAS